MLVTGKEVLVDHCQHCMPLCWWAELEGKNAPSLIFKHFPKDGVVVLSKNLVVVQCGKCIRALEFAKANGCP